MNRKAWGRCFLIVLLPGLAILAGRPLFHLARVWWEDPAQPLAIERSTHDAGRLSAATPREIIPIAPTLPEAERQVVDLVQRAGRDHLHVSIVGAGHSMGGHTLYPGGLSLDMLPFRQMRLDAGKRILTVGAGARWLEILPYLDHEGLSVAVMQSNNDFSVGGSLSVNCHGWQFHSPPLISSVEAFRLVTPQGRIVRCSRDENRELFSLAAGGYGLFGVILEVELRVVPNEFYEAEFHQAAPEHYASLYDSLTQDRKDIGLIYGRLSVAPQSFLEDGYIALLRRKETGASVRDTLSPKQTGHSLSRLVFRGSVGSDYGKNFRWEVETLVNGARQAVLSRNEILNEPSEWFSNRDSRSAEILHEYFVPPDQMTRFIGRIKPVLARHHPDLLNITVRDVEPDSDTMLSYASRRMLGFVMLFHQGLGPADEAEMRALTRELIDQALACGGTYYLPYRPHATQAQFEQAYPRAREFFRLKREYDPAGIFENEFYLNYGANDQTPR